MQFCISFEQELVVILGLTTRWRHFHFDESAKLVLVLQVNTCVMNECSEELGFCGRCLCEIQNDHQ